MDVYPAHKFLNGLNGLKRDVKRPKPISGPQRQKRTKTLNGRKIGKLIREDRRLSIRELAEITGIDKECVRQILYESFTMRKVCAKVVSKLLTPEQKESRMNICADILSNIDTDTALLDTVITCDESWCFTYDPETSAYHRANDKDVVDSQGFGQNKVAKLFIANF
ncbi:hypothetical protein NQ318_016635 [Aromia moschata]|uniref:Transposase n=1 Tax=Aromia moschata TaxID=1265417 RepID=A0AAV8XU38_9CUCU|nr:hypothetical protein NQ318_016635 [Aromia moschata]